MEIYSVSNNQTDEDGMALRSLFSGCNFCVKKVNEVMERGNVMNNTFRAVLPPATPVKNSDLV